jgi:hypothetical protein
MAVVDHMAVYMRQKQLTKSCAMLTAHGNKVWWLNTGVPGAEFGQTQP